MLDLSQEKNRKRKQRKGETMTWEIFFHILHFIFDMISNVFVFGLGWYGLKALEKAVKEPELSKELQDALKWIDKMDNAAK